MTYTLLAPSCSFSSCSVFKTLHNPDSPKCNQDLLTLRKSTYNLRGSNITVLPKLNTTTYGLKSWRYSAVKLWNSMPDPCNQSILSFFVRFHSANDPQDMYKLTFLNRYLHTKLSFVLVCSISIPGENYQHCSRTNIQVKL